MLNHEYTEKKNSLSWSDTKEKIKLQWAKISNDEIDAFKTDVDLLKGQLQKTYGYSKDFAEKEYERFMRMLAAVKSGESKQKDIQMKPKPAIASDKDSREPMKYE